jgi:hypothetical protein
VSSRRLCQPSWGAEAAGDGAAAAADAGAAASDAAAAATRAGVAAATKDANRIADAVRTMAAMLPFLS